MGNYSAQIKCILFVANFIFVIAALVLIGLGTAGVIQVTELKVNDQLQLLHEGPYQMALLATLLLGIVHLLAFMIGLCGAINESKALLIIFLLFLLILATGSIWLASNIFLDFSVEQKVIKQLLTDAWNHNSTLHNNILHHIEVEFKCCGHTDAKSSVPIVPGCAYPPCVDVVVNYMKTFAGAIGGTLVIVIITEVGSCLGEAGWVSTLGLVSPLVLNLIYHMTKSNSYGSHLS